MMKYLKFLTLLLCVICTACLEEKTMQNTTLIPRKTLFGNPDKVSVKLSPDGKYLSYIAPLNGVLNVYVAPSDDLSKAKAITNDTGRGIRTYTWLYTSKHVVFSQDKDGDENFALYLVNLDDNSEKNISPEGAKAMILGASDEMPFEIAYGVNDRNQSYFDVYHYDVRTGASTMVFQNDEYASVLLDEQLHLRFASKTLPDGSIEVSEKKDSGFEPFDVVDFEDTTYTGLLHINRAGTKMYMLSSKDRDTSALLAYEFASGKSSVVATPENGEIADVMVDPKTLDPQGYTYNYDMEKRVLLDNTLEADFKYLESVDKGEVQIASRTLADDKWIVAYVKDNAPISYYIYDRTAKKAQFLFVHNSKLAELPLAKMHPVKINARDGLEMVAYLTLPVWEKTDASGLVPSKPLPMVLVVHGGPQARDEWGYNSQHQMFANRGYAVLSVNYRGSLGFGKKFVLAGNGEWAGKMHDDLIDAVNWATEKGIADKSKVAIFGGSYGGYAALVGLTLTPDVFACGVDIVGPSNLSTLYNSIPPYWAPFRVSLQKMIGGNPETEEGKAILESKSPLNFADKINKPLLIAQGSNDPRVKQAESDQMVDMMKQKQVPAVYLLYPDEGHGFARPENRSSFYAYADGFLAQFLGGRSEPIEHDLEGASVIVQDGSEYLTAFLK